MIVELIPAVVIIRSANRSPEYNIEISDLINPVAVFLLDFYVLISHTSQIQEQVPLSKLE